MNLYEWLYEWFQRVFCSRVVSLLAKCREERENTNSYAEVLEQDLKGIKACLTECRQFNEELADKNFDLMIWIGDLQEDVLWFKDRMQAYEKRLNNAIEIPDIAPYVSNAVTIEPYEHEALGVVRDLLCADRTYLAFPYADWVAILGLVQPLVERRWIRNVGDCDNFALDTVFLVARACLEAGLEYQGAITITWSRSHAYNVFVTAEGDAYVYEPQNGEVVGKLGETERPYDSEKIWFPQEAAESSELTGNGKKTD